MRIRFLTNMGSRDTDLVPLPREGDELDIDERIGGWFVARNWAIDITPPPQPTIQAIPDRPEIAEAKGPEIEADDEPPEAEAERSLKDYVQKQRRKQKEP